MSNLTKEEAISTLERLRFPEPWEPKLSKRAEDALDMAISALSENKGEWIPVSERLPEDGAWAIFTDGKSISVERFKLDAENHFFPNGRWFEFDEAIAWQPLPEPYKAEREE